VASGSVPEREAGAQRLRGVEEEMGECAVSTEAALREKVRVARVRDTEDAKYVRCMVQLLKPLPSSLLIVEATVGSRSGASVGAP
jgi:hypothetical protein